MENILVTGGCGYIGSHLCKQIKNYNVIVYDNMENGCSYMNKSGKVYKGDLCETEKIIYLFEKYRFKTIIHLAGLAHISDSIKNPSLYYHNNLLLSIQLLDIAVKYKIKNFIFSSSCTVYGNYMLKNSPKHIILETDPIVPINPYGCSKMMFEYILKDYSNEYKFNYSILRYFNASGSDPEFEIGEYHKEEKRLIPRLIKYSLGLIDNMHIYGNNYETHDGTPVRDYTHVCDIASSHIKALEYMIKNNKSIICNIGSGKGYSINEIILMIEKISKKKLKIEIINKREGDAAFTVCSNEYAKKMINWEPKFDIKDIIQTSYSWYSNYLPLIINKLNTQDYNVINQLNKHGNLYTGQIKNGKYNGEGELVYPDGDICKGIFRDNEFIKGKLIMKNGCIEYK